MLNISRDVLSHPGEVLKDILEGMNITPMELAEKTNTDIAYISMILINMADITKEFASKLESFIGISMNYWLTLQEDYNKFKDLNNV